MSKCFQENIVFLSIIMPCKYAKLGGKNLSFLHQIWIPEARNGTKEFPSCVAGSRADLYLNRHFVWWQLAGAGPSLLCRAF